AQGIARFSGYQLPGDPAEPLIILAEEGNDFSFVHLPSSRIATTDFDVRGREYLDKGYEAFAYLDRDIFRPGDEGNLVAVVRGPGAALPPEFPVKLEIRQPDGQIFRELVGNTGDRGACAFTLNIPDYAQTGSYQARIFVGGNEIGSTSFQVEEFMPDRIKVTVTPDRDAYHPGEECRIQVAGVNLFGPPAAGRRTEVRLRLEAADFTPPAYASYRFGDPERSFTAKTEELGEGKLDAEGKAYFTYRFPQGLTPPAKLNAIIQATVIEDGGRAVSNYEAVTFHPYANYIGVKALSGNYCELGKPFTLKYVVLDADGNPVPDPQLTAEVYRLTWNTIYRRDSDGRYRYVSEEERRKVHTEKLSQAEGEFTYTPQDFGRYLVILRDPETKAQASFSFYASGWGYSPWAMEDPDKIELDLDKERYAAGEKAQLQIKAPFAGKALVTVERERVYDYWIVDLAANTGVVSIPVKEEYKPNVYLSVHLLRSASGLEAHAPARAFGTVPLMVDNSQARLGIDLEAPAELRPNREVAIKVRVGNAGPGTCLTLAAVDEGICQLTDYAVPDPFAFFYGKRRLSLASYDLYGMLLPEVPGMTSESTPGGDRDVLDRVRKQNLNPVSLRRVKPVSLWSGLVSPDQKGEATVRFTLPQFNGTLRLMAVAFDGQRFGAAESKVIVGDPIVLTPTFPRFVAPQDRFTVPVAVFNGTGKDGTFTLRLTSEGPVTLASMPVVTLELAAGEEKSASFQLEAGQGMGTLRFRLEVEGNGETCVWEEELALRPPVALTHEITSGTITQRDPLTFTIKDRWLPGTATYTLALSPFPSVELAGSLEYLLTYPYGCLEQTVSKLFPLLYFDYLLSAVEGGTFTGKADYYVTEGIEKIEAMQLRDGSFAYWPGGTYGNEWSSIYAAHFLVEARKAGYVVSDRVYNRMISYLKATVRGKEKDRYRLQAKVYALYVLSLNGSPDLSTMAYWRRYAPEDLSGDARALLAAAYFYTGDRVTARELLPATFAVEVFPRESGGNFNSTVRTDALILSVLADVDPYHPAVYQLVNRLNEAARGGRWGTTQENAFALLALGKLYKEKSDGTYRGEVYLGKEKIAEFDSTQDLVLNDPRLAEGKITVKLEGDGACYYYLKSSGLSTRRDLPEQSNGIKVTREYFDRQGNPLDLSRIRQGDLIVARIKIQPEQAGLENVGIVDLLPAGLEIENPRIESRESISWLPKETVSPAYLDVRDDRLILFVNLPKAKIYYFYYALRAVTCGEFILPSIKAECMYAPEITSLSSSGVIRVVAD
ncbi:MAG TPA: MG2 domain-containing protein, partial [Capillibacterium sp.]